MNKNILMIIRNLYNAPGGAERVFCHVANDYVQNKHEVTVLSFDCLENESFYPLDDRVKIIRANKHSSLDQFIYMRKFLKERSFDLVLSFMPSSYILASFATIGLDIKLIASEHNVYSNYKKRTIYKIMLNLSARLLETITVVSEQAKSTFPKKIQDKMIVVPNPYIDISNGRKSKLDSKIILSIGSLTTQKNHSLLINSINEIKDKLDGWKLKIIGKGPLKDNLLKQIDSLGLSNIIEILPPTKNIKDYYINSSLFVLPSIYESQGLVVLEALSFGIPVIALESCPGVNKIIINPSLGSLVDAKDFGKEILAVIDGKSFDISEDDFPKLENKYLSLVTD